MKKLISNRVSNNEIKIFGFEEGGIKIGRG